MSTNAKLVLVHLNDNPEQSPQNPNAPTTALLIERSPQLARVLLVPKIKPTVHVPPKLLPRPENVAPVVHAQMLVDLAHVPDPRTVEVHLQRARERFVLALRLVVRYGSAPFDVVAAVQLVDAGHLEHQEHLFESFVSPGRGGFATPGGAYVAVGAECVVGGARTDRRSQHVRANRTS